MCGGERAEPSVESLAKSRRVRIALKREVRQRAYCRENIPGPVVQLTNHELLPDQRTTPFKGVADQFGDRLHHDIVESVQLARLPEAQHESAKRRAAHIADRLRAAGLDAVRKAKINPFPGETAIRSQILAGDDSAAVQRLSTGADMRRP